MLAGNGQLGIQSTLHRSPQSLAKAFLHGNQVKWGSAQTQRWSRAPDTRFPLTAERMRWDQLPRHGHLGELGPGGQTEGPGSPFLGF